MTAHLEKSDRTLLDLIQTCREAEAGFRSAAEAVEDATLKRVFHIYAQQRNRFAEELRVYRTFDRDESAAGSSARWGGSGGLATDNEMLLQQLESDERVLASYRSAILERTLPAKAQFLISAQCALMERVRDRMKGFLTSLEAQNTGAPIKSRQAAL